MCVQLAPHQFPFKAPRDSRTVHPGKAEPGKAEPARDGKWVKHPLSPVPVAYQAVAATPNLKNKAGMTILRIFTYTLTVLYGLTHSFSKGK